MAYMRKFKLFFGILLLGAAAAAQGPLYLGTKTPYPGPSGGYTSPPAGFQPVFINYVGRHGARFMTKAGPDVEALRLLEAAEGSQGLTEVGLRVRRMVRRLCEIEKGQYENITLLGAEEQQAIGQRMLSRYPAVFTGKGLDVVVTYKVRTQQSADAFLKAFAGYKGQRRFSKLADSLDVVLRFYDLSPAYQRYKKSAGLKTVLDSLARDRRTGEAAAAVCERVFTPGFRASLKPADELRFAGNLYDLYSVQFSLVRETRDSVDLGIAFGVPQLAWEDFVSGAQDFLEKGPGRDPLGIQVKVAAPLLVDFVKRMDEVVRRGAATDGSTGMGGSAAMSGSDAVLRFTHAEAISPFATLLGISEASVPASDIYDYSKHWRVGDIIPLSANVQWIVYSNGKEYLIKVLLNEREVKLPLGGGVGAFYRWEELREYCLERLRAVGADPEGSMLEYLKGLQ
jgi:multiple inositol-polyphosphate phosphatase/2,3-bisphosphoglycerate 3-phosphatase